MKAPARAGALAPLDVVVDLVAGPQWPALLEVLKPRGRYAVAGAGSQTLAFSTPGRPTRARYSEAIATQSSVSAITAGLQAIYCGEDLATLIPRRGWEHGPGRARVHHDADAVLRPEPAREHPQ